MSSNVQPMFNMEKLTKHLSNYENKPMEYIMFQNNELLGLNKELNRKIAELSNENEELEHEVDSITKARLNLQGHVKNFHELSKYEKEIADNYLKGVVQFAYNYLLCFSIQMFVLIVTLNIQDEYKITFACTTYSVYSVYKFISIRKIYKDYLVNTSIKRKIDKINQANDHIQELIDNI